MLKRLNINMSEKLVEWYDTRAAEMGVSRSAVMCMAMQEYMEQKSAIGVMDELIMLANKMKEVENGIEKEIKDDNELDEKNK